MGVAGLAYAFVALQNRAARSELPRDGGPISHDCVYATRHVEARRYADPPKSPPPPPLPVEPYSAVGPRISELLQKAAGEEGLTRKAAFQSLKQASSRDLLGPHLARFALHTNPDVREFVLQTLWSAGPDADLAYSLAYAIHHQLAAAHLADLVYAIESGFVISQKLLPQLYAHPDARLRLAVIETVAKLQKNDVKTMHMLIESLGHPCDVVQSAAAAAIRKTRTEEAVLHQFLISRANERGDAEAAKTLRLHRLKELRNAASVPFLIELVEAEKQALKRITALRLLASVSPNWESALPVLIWTFENDPTIQVRLQAAVILGEMGPSAQAAVPVFLRQLDGNEPFDLQLEILKSLERIRPDDEDLMKIIRQRGVSVRMGKLRHDLNAVVQAQEELNRETRALWKKRLVQRLKDLGLLDRE
jgi:hypothetical protein